MSVAVSAVEIYNEHVRDLLPPNSNPSAFFGSSSFFSLDTEHPAVDREERDKSQNNSNSVDLPIYEEKETGSTYIHGVSIIKIRNEEEAISLLKQANCNRHYSKHDINHKSNRSHCIYTLHLTTKTSTHFKIE